MAPVFVWPASRLRALIGLHPEPPATLSGQSQLLADSGCQGLVKLHPKSRTPHKRWRKKTPLTDEQRAFNQTLASERVLVENVIRRLKGLRVLKETYRQRRRRHGWRVHLLAGLYNHDLNVPS